MPPMHTAIASGVEPSGVVEAQNASRGVLADFRQGASRVSGLGQGLYIGGAREEAAA
jgi:hypothetical protein